MSQVTTEGSGSGCMTSFFVEGDTGSTETITNGNTLKILNAAGGSIKTVGQATDEITIDLAVSGVTAGAYTNADITVNNQGLITAAADGAGGSGTTFAIWNDTKDGLDGGTSVDDTWTTRDLNTEVANNITGASLAADTITLPAGTYRLNATAPAYFASEHAARLYNDTDAAVVQVGSAAFNQITGVSVSVINAYFTIAGEKDFIIQHNVNTAKADNGFGRKLPGGWATDSVYTQVMVTKE